MKTFRIIGRNFRDAFKGVFRNFSLSFASISCITITLIVVAVSMVLSNNVDNFTQLVEKDVTIVAFINNEATDEQIEEIKDEISTINNVDTYEFRSKQEITTDGEWHTVIFDLWSNENVKNLEKITSWRWDWCDTAVAGDTMEVDYIRIKN